MKSVLYAGSFDPPTNGHIDVVRRMVELFNDREIMVGIGKNYDKNNSDFSVEERVGMFRKALSVYPELEKVNVTTFEGSLGGYAYENMATVLKGVRDAKDFEYEKNQFEAIEMQELGVDTVLLPARKEMSSIASSYVKGLQKAGLSIEKLVHPYVKQCLEARLSGQYVMGVTGEIGTGKSTICRKIQKLGKEKGIPVHYIDLDKIPHDIYDGIFKEPVYTQIRKQIVEMFGKDVELPDGRINRKILGEIVFNDRRQLQRLNEIVYKPMMTRLRREMSNKSGLIIIEAALAAELGMTYLSNNNYILVSADRKSQEKRLRERGLTDEQIKRRVESQITTELKREIIQREISENKHGKIWEINNSDGLEPPLNQTLDKIIENIDQYGQLRFMGMWNRIGADGTPDREYERLFTTYLEPHRVYHSLPHIVSGLDEISDARRLMVNSDQVMFAWFYHDYVFRDGSRVNEVESAKTAYNICKEARLDETFAQNVKNLVLATKHHSNLSIDSIDEGFIKDIDLAIFGKSVEQFDMYDDGIREEYRNEDSEAFKKGRVSLLQEFLKRPHIYYTDFFRQKYETKAKENLQRAITRLST
jgi:pantetheine-phosphate adenylyltransferase/dephospho-CoA kinase